MGCRRFCKTVYVNIMFDQALDKTETNYSRSSWYNTRSKYMNMTLKELSQVPQHRLYLRLIEVVFLDHLEWKDNGTSRKLEKGASVSPQVYARGKNDECELVVEAYIPIDTLTLIIHDKASRESVRLLFEYKNKAGLLNILEFLDENYDVLNLDNFNQIVLNLTEDVSVNSVSTKTIRKLRNGN